MTELIGAPESFSRHCPTASKFSSANPSGSIREWQLAHTELFRCCSMRSRSAVGALFPSFSFSGGTLGGGGGGGDPSRFSRTHLPRSTTEVRFAYEVTVRILPWPSSPSRRSSVSVTRRKWLP